MAGKESDHLLNSLSLVTDVPFRNIGFFLQFQDIAMNLDDLRQGNHPTHFATSTDSHQQSC